MEVAGIFCVPEGGSLLDIPLTNTNNTHSKQNPITNKVQTLINKAIINDLIIPRSPYPDRQQQPSPQRYNYSCFSNKTTTLLDDDDNHIEFSRRWFEKSEELIRDEIQTRCSKCILGGDCDSPLEKSCGGFPEVGVGEGGGKVMEGKSLSDACSVSSVVEAGNVFKGEFVHLKSSESCSVVTHRMSRAGKDGKELDGQGRKVLGGDKNLAATVWFGSSEGIVDKAEDFVTSNIEKKIGIVRNEGKIKDRSVRTFLKRLVRCINL